MVLKIGYVPKIKYVYGYCGVSNTFLNKYDIHLTEVDRYRIENLVNIPKILSKHINSSLLEKNYKVIVYVSRVEIMEKAVEEVKGWFCEAFPNNNINLYTQYYKNSEKYNKQQLLKFIQNNTNKDIDVILTIDMLNEGIHLPTVSTIIMLRKTTSPVVFNQQIGRTINNGTPVIFDLVHNGKKLNINKIKHCIKNNFSEGISREKVMFEDICEVIDETQDIRCILEKYHKYITDRVTEDIKQQILNEENIDVSYLCKKYGFCDTTIRKILQKAGKISKAYTKVVNKVPDCDKVNIIEDRKSGMSIKDISNKYSYSKSTITAICCKHNIRKIRKSYSNSELKTIINSNRDYIINNNGVISREVIANNLGISLSQLKRGMMLSDIKLKRMHSSLNMDIELLNSIKTDYDTGLFTKKQLKEKYNLSDYNLKMCFKQLGYDFSIKRFKLTEEQLGYILQNYQSTTTSEIAKHLGIDVKYVTSALKRRGLPFISINGYNEITEQEELEICKLYESLGSLYKVKKQTGRHKNTIKRIVIKYGYTINSPRNNKN